MHARRGPGDQAISFARSYARLLESLIALEQAHFDRALELIAAHGLAPSDALLAAAAIARDATLVTADVAFGRVGRLKVTAPDSAI